MKIVSGFLPAFFRFCPVFCFVLVVCSLVVVGCGKAKKPAAEAVTPAPENVKPAQADPAPVYSPTPSAAPVVVAAPNGEPDLAELNRSLLRWMMSNRRRPASFEDFAATAGVVIPPAPAGKKYVIASNMHIVLVKK